MNATIFFGNGINRISDKPLDWNELLKRLAVYASVKVDLAEKPYTMIYEELLFLRETILLKGMFISHSKNVVT